ncbi:MAG: RNA-binding transcriptional accessory protein [Bacteroidales bacterium]|nr:RNA-binding transcriptional accessory protein [Bacteroidales bacterium]
MKEEHIRIIASRTGLSHRQVENTLSLLAEGATIPFISRYRKEMTGNLDEVAIAEIRDMWKQLKELDKRRETILSTIEEQGNLTDELKEKIEKASTMAELEDLYLPYRPKKKTRATVARSKGLEPLAKMLMAQDPGDPVKMAERFIDPEKEVVSAENALAGARDIIAEWVNESQKARARMRRLYLNEGMISSKVVKEKEQEGKNYRTYFDWEEQLKKSPSHRILAMLRGETEGFLRIHIAPDRDKALDLLDDIFLKSDNASADEVATAIEDGYKRLMHPSMETEMRQWAKEKADEQAIKVFSENLRQLLLSPPLGGKRVLAIDPGFRTGCKVVCLDQQGKLLYNETIYPHPPQREVRQALKKMQSLVNAYNIEAIAIGNGTAGRETEEFIQRVPFDKDVIAVMVNESGASVYSTSTVARKEFPDYDVTVRGAVSIGRRLMDPLAELVKIEPKSIGVGQYQHDVNQSKLHQSLDDTVMSCVNAVGVEVNTASEELLTYVSGVGPGLAKNIVTHRNENGPFASRQGLKKVKRFGDKAFEQAAGFLRIYGAKNPLDASAVHPESYHVVEEMAGSLDSTINDLIKQKELRQQLKLENFVNEKVGMPTLKDIMSELEKPGRDPRERFVAFEFDERVHSINDLEEGMILPGIVTNITNFGAFVDVGVHQDGLVHISQMADKFVSDPNEIVRLQQKVLVKVIDVDFDRNRIQFAMKGIDQRKHIKE